MKSSIKIGPIQKAKPTDDRAAVISDRISKMKVGNFFEVTGLSTKNDVLNFRASLQYFSKKKEVRIITSMKNGVLKVERVKSDKTKELSEVK